MRKRTDKLRMDRLLGWWSQNAPASSACGARRAVLGRKRLLLTPAAVCASPQGGRKTAIAPILTRTQLFRTAAWGLPKCSLAKLYLSDNVLGSFAPAGATRACAALDLRPGSPGGHILWDRRFYFPEGGGLSDPK